MLTRRAVIIFNCGMALVFLLIGGLSTYALSLIQPIHEQTMARLIDQGTVQAIKDEGDIERARLKALYYLDLARDIQKRRYEEVDQKYYDARLLSIVVAAAFLIGASMVASWRPGSHSNKPPTTSP
jgi:hypothetical protein